MIRSISIFFLCVFLSHSVCVHAQDAAPYKIYNPNGGKYDFARSYITSLGYLKGVESRWKRSDEVKKKDGEEKLVEWNIERLIMENMDVRVAKNYMTKYLKTNNSLMYKVVDSYSKVCDQLVSLNIQERQRWEELKGWKEKGEFNGQKDQQFVKIQEDFARQRKETMREIVENAIFMTKVLLDENTKEKQIKKHLALTSQEREKLIRKLDAFAKDNLDWGLKEGQTFLQAAEASIREVLEDPAYLSADEK